MTLQEFLKQIDEKLKSGELNIHKSMYIAVYNDVANRVVYKNITEIESDEGITIILTK